MAGREGPAAKAKGVRTAGMGHQRITSLLIRAEKAPHSRVSVCLFWTMFTRSNFKDAPLSGHGPLRCLEKIVATFSSGLPQAQTL